MPTFYPLSLWERELIFYTRDEEEIYLDDVDLVDLGPITGTKLGPRAGAFNEAT